MALPGTGTVEPHSQRGCLWNPKVSIEHNQSDNDSTEGGRDFVDYNGLWSKYAQTCPYPMSLLFYVSQNLVVVQEVALTLNFLLRYHILLVNQRQDEYVSYQRRLHQKQKNELSSFVMMVALLMVVVFNYTSATERKRPSLTSKARHRLTDACLIGILLRVLSSLLQSLTASYADDAVQTLALYGMILHLLLCDYAYANGEDMKTSQHRQKENDQAMQDNWSSGSGGFYSRPTFEGGTISLNAAFFATVLLISRLNDNLTGYVLCLIAVISFAFYPLTRHELAKAYPATTSRKFRRQNMMP